MSKEQSKTLFYTQGEEEVLKSLDTSVDGLSTAQAKERLDAYGYNELDEGEKRSLLSKFIDQFKDLMIIILLVAAALSVITEGMHGLTDACIILAVVVLNAAFGVYQEGQAEAAIEALKNMSSPMAQKNWYLEISSCLKQVMSFLRTCVCSKQPHLRLKKLPLQVNPFRLKKTLPRRLKQRQVSVTV